MRATEVIDGIYRLKLPLPITGTTLGHINAYLVRGDDGYLLVDAGWHDSRVFDSLGQQLADIGVDVGLISSIVVTHIHPDHYGLVGELKKLAPAARFYLHRLEKELIETRYINMDELLQQTAHWLLNNGVPPEEVPGLQTASVGAVQFVAPTMPDVTLEGGEMIDAGDFHFRVFWSPGHSPGHICLYEPEKKILLSGDHILPTITPNIGLHPQSGANPLGKYLQSVAELGNLEVKLVLPGHEDPFSAFEKRVEELIWHHHQRSTIILDKLLAGAMTAYQIAQQVDWQGGLGWNRLPRLHKRLALFETLSHLELMRSDGRAEKLSRDGIIYYQRN